MSRSYQGVRNFLDQSRRYRGTNKITIKKKKKLRKHDRKLAIEEVSSQLFKTVFREEENTDMNAIMYATQPMIQITY